MKFILIFIYSLILMSTKIEKPKLEQLNENKIIEDKIPKYRTNDKTIFILDDKEINSEEWLKKSEKLEVIEIDLAKDKTTIIKIIGKTK